MKKYLKYSFGLLIILLSGSNAFGQITATTEQTYQSINPKIDPNYSYEDMTYLDFSKPFQLGADLSGGIIGDVNFDGEIKLEVYSYDPSKSDGKGFLIYGIKLHIPSNTYSGVHWMVSLPGKLPYITRSTNFKGLVQGAKAFYDLPENDPCGAYLQNAIFYGEAVALFNLYKWFKGDCNLIKISNQPVIVEATIKNATFNKFKVPGLGEFDALSFFRALPPGHGCIGQTTAECETLREFRYGDFEKAIVTAHRGFWGYGDIPEVTMVGLENAYNNNYVSVEIDILQTKDNELALMHDQAVNRMTSLPDTYEGCFNDNTNSNSFQRTDAAWLKNLNYNSTTQNVELADHSIQSSYPAVSSGHYVDRRGEINYNAPLAKLEDALDYIQNRPILLSLDIKEQDEDSYLNTLKKCIQAGKAKGVLHKMVFKPGSAARIPYQKYKGSLEAAGLWEDFAKKSNVIVILFHPKDDLKQTVPKEEVDGWISLPSLVCFEFIYKYSNPDNENEVFDAILKPWPEYDNKSVIQYVKERGYRTGINWEIATECRGLPNGRGQWYDRGAPEYQNNVLIGIDTRNNPEWVLNPPGNHNAPGAIVTDRPDVTIGLLQLLGRYNTHSKRN